MVSYHSVSSREGASTPPGHEPDKEHHPRLSGISNHRFLIAVNWFIITVPICVLTAALLGLVFYYRINHGASPYENLRGNLEQNENNVYYIDMNPSVLLFVASWASCLAPMLSGFVLTLASFPIARQIFQDIQRNRTNRLLTPYQLALTLKFLDGSTIGGLWNWILYLSRWGRRRAPQAPALTAASSVAIVATSLGNDGRIYSLGLIRNCLNSNNSVAAQFHPAYPNPNLCSIIVAGTGAFFANPTISLEVLNNASNLTTVYTYHTTDPNPITYTYLGIPDTPSLANRDYTVRTYGAATQCSLISSQCSLQPYASFDTFDCTAFNGILGSSLWLEQYFTDETMANNNTRDGASNPYYHAAAGVVNQSGGNVPNSTEFVQMQHGGKAFILGCNSAIYDIEYDRVNASITRFVPTLSNTSVSNIWQSANSNTMDGSYAVQQAVAAATFSETAQEFADKVALAFSKVSLAVGAEALEKRPALAVQDRRMSLVARIPAAPLISLVVVNLLYVLCGFAFAAVALITTACHDQVPDIQARLNIAGLVADRFEDRGREINCAEEMFEEYAGKDNKRVAIECVSEGGGYEYTIRRRGHML